MTTEIETQDITKNIMDELPEEISKAVALNDLGKLSDDNKIQYYYAFCKSLGMNPLQKPFEFIKFQGGAIQLYATKNCGQQLAVRNGISLVKVDEKVADGLMEITYRASTNGESGRQVDDIGVVSIKGLFGNDLANAKMKCHTKAMRRVTFSFLGLGILDETEIGTIKGATKSEPDFESETIVNEVPVVQDAEASDTLISEPVPEGDMWCSEHNLEFFKRGAMRNYAHPVVNENNATIGWCNRPKEEPVQGSLA
jgi:hypothetical protein